MKFVGRNQRIYTLLTCPTSALREVDEINRQTQQVFFSQEKKNIMNKYVSSVWRRVYDKKYFEKFK